MCVHRAGAAGWARRALTDACPVPGRRCCRRQAVLWLEDYLLNWKKMVIIVSHARDFLDAVVTDIVHMQNKKLTRYKVPSQPSPPRPRAAVS